MVGNLNRIARNRVSDKIKSRFIRVYQWKRPSAQHSLPFVDSEPLLEDIFRQKAHDLLVEAYDIIFCDCVNVDVVFCTFKKYVEEKSLGDNFREELRGDLFFLLRCIEERSKDEDILDNPQRPFQVLYNILTKAL